MKRVFLSAGLAVAGLMGIGQEPIDVVIRGDKPGYAIPRTLYGIFFEDINYAADGGIYPELVANRGFDWRTRDPEGWSREWRGEAMGRVSLQGEKPLHPRTWQYLRIECYAPGDGAGVVNHGFGGMAVKGGAKYDLTFYARPHADYSGGLSVILEDAEGKLLASYRIERGQWRNRRVEQRKVESVLESPELSEWERYTSTMVPQRGADSARLAVLLDARGTVDLEFVSLYPQDTYKGRKNGMRPDLMEMLHEMRPSTLRFPGGCVVEGYNFETLYHWKRTVGPVEGRAINHNRWGYWQSHGLGYFEYFQMAEDLGAEPLPILAAGMTCQFHPLECIPMESMDLVIEDALDLIEFANGAESTPWGRVRTEMGHPEPFNMKYLGVGNENWDNVFLERYEVIARAIKAKHPEITVISSAGAGPDGKMFDLAWSKLPAMKAELVDEHYYRPPQWFLGQAERYDNYDRNGPKVYVGEYACHTWDRKNNLWAALCEAAAMTGFERNSDIVSMAAYAPLFNKIGSTQWNIDLIWFDNTRVFGTPSYYVQKLFMNHLPDLLLPVEGQERVAALPPMGSIGLDSWLTAVEYKDIRVRKGGETLYSSEQQSGLSGWSKPGRGEWEVVDGVMRQSDPKAKGTLITLLAGTGWEDYTVELKARKLAGDEGFIIRVRDQRSSYVHLNLGGWGNRDHGLEQDGQNPVLRKPGVIESGRWYDVKIELAGERIKAWLDGEQLFDHAIPNLKIRQAYLVAGLDRGSGEVVLKAVNPGNREQPLKLSLAGSSIAAQQAKLITLRGSPGDVNSMEEPLKVAPIEEVVNIGGDNSTVVLPPYSFSVLRFKGGN